MPSVDQLTALIRAEAWSPALGLGLTVRARAASLRDVPAAKAEYRAPEVQLKPQVHSMSSPPQPSI